MKLIDRYQIDNYIDTFALGHYARVLSASDLKSNQTVAFKVMRPEHVMTEGDMRWEFKAFGNEAEILMKLKDSPHVVNLYDCGYVSTIGEAPSGGDIISYDTDVAMFTAAQREYAEKGWRPYLSLELLPRNENLYYAMKPSKQSLRRRVPVEEGISLALQFAYLLQLAHDKDIVYLDHKLEHVYWDGVMLRVIDFNSSRQINATGADRKMLVKDIHNLCVGILYPVFTGMSPQKASLRPQPGGQDTVDTRYEDITELDFGMVPDLSSAMQELLQHGAAMEYDYLKDFIDDLKRVASLHGRDFPEFSSNPASRDARDQMKAGLKLLREGEANIREARDLFREAVVLDGITEDLENELRRLVKNVNDMLNNRAIP